MAKSTKEKKQNKKRHKSATELSYGVQRVSYLTSVLAEAYADLATERHACPKASRVALLLMVRNLDEFFYGSPNSRFPDDLRFSHYSKLKWTPPSEGQVKQETRKRLDQTIAHVVDHDPGHFGSRKQVKKLAKCTFKVACEFLCQCLACPDVRVTERTEGYIADINCCIPRIASGYKSWNPPLIK